MISLLLGGLSTLISTLGPVVTKVASSLLTKLPEIVEVALKVSKVISSVVQSVAEIQGLSPHGEDVEELGFKAMQEGTRAKMENESMDDYLNYLRNEVSVDKKKFQALSDEDKLKCNVMGTGMLSQSISEKSGLEISGDFLLDMHKMKMSGEQLSKYIDAFSEKGVDSLDELPQYLRGELNDRESAKIEAIIKSIEKTSNPSLSDGEVLLRMDDMKQAVEEKL